MQNYTPQLTIRYSASVKLKEMQNWLKNFEYKEIDVFGVIVKVPVKEYEKLEKELTDLRIIMEFMSYKHYVRGNNSLLEIQIDFGKAFDYHLDFELFPKGFFIDPNKPLTKKSKVRKVALRVESDYRSVTTFESIDNFYRTIQFLKKNI